MGTKPIEVFATNKTVGEEQEPKTVNKPSSADRNPPINKFNVDKTDTVHDQMYSILRATKDFAVRATRAANDAPPGSFVKSGARMMNGALRVLIDGFDKAEASPSYRKKWLGTAYAVQSYAVDLWYDSEPGLVTRFKAQLDALWIWGEDELIEEITREAKRELEKTLGLPTIAKVGLAILGGGVVYWIIKKVSGPTRRALT